MELQEIKNSINLLDYIRSSGKTAKKEGNNIYRINPCPVCGHKDHFTVYTETNSYASFNNCVQGGDVINYFQEVEGMDSAEAIKKVKSLAGVEIMENYKKNNPLKEKPATEAETLTRDYTEFTLELYHKMKPQDKEYLLNRGIPEHLIDQYKLSVGSSTLWSGNRALFPSWNGEKVIGYTSRATQEGQEPKYQEASGDKAIFNQDLILKASEGDVIPIFEGCIDSILFEKATNIKGVAMKGNGINHVKELIKNAPKGVTYLTGFDNDKAGKDFTEKLGYKSIEIPEGYKDMADFVNGDEQSDFENVLNALQKAQGEAEGITEDISHYIAESFLDELEENRNAPRIKTGINALDVTLNGGLYPGLHIIGGEPGIGKTSFSMQLADKIAAQGRPVLYISLEMSKYELTSRSLSRVAYETDNKREHSTGKILNGEIEKADLMKYIEIYKESIGRNLTIIQGDFGLKLEDIKREAAIVKKLRGHAPVIIVDYLQILQGNDPKKDIRLIIDENLVFLKRMSRDLNTPVIAISSLSRSGQKEISMASFKESGSIEYTCDSLMALSFDMGEMKGTDKDLEEQRRETRERFIEENGYYPITLSVLKNRRGMKGMGINLEWEPAYNWFHAPVRNIKHGKMI